MAKLINGNKISADIKNEIKQEVEELVRIKGLKPGLAVILVGENPASKVYVANKQKGCDEVGFASETIKMSDTASTEDILAEIDKLNNRKDMHGILVQLPLPPQVDKNMVLEAILPEKDVDGFHPVNMGRLVAQQECLVPATPSGIIEMLKREGIKIRGANATMVGHSEIVGKPCTLLLLNEWATVTICHIETKDLKMHTKNA
ncbi:MAG: bifunctional 5,10-methylenetetrahydrofolate dehydrogenase/5,10-methenyltetrahydrofolate cyclohydrolase, partial [Actinomycetia bacterium]|nr:bifunctional 5,10-methylenetetrahydrofolate dehydrogenase/5,10-methenyltetrahydrofolate cyclohydrolase [Actinomycetes bacterium]